VQSGKANEQDSKRKLGNDPNNTKWSRNTETFGQRMLRSQGWEPGQYLGAQGAEHAQWHTEANSTHIRVMLKDDQLGLGAKRNNGDECTGLDAFQMLLGRLNGKSEDALETERKAREDHKLNVYVERKLGTIRFVSGGFLVGDQVVHSISGQKAVSQPSSAKESAVTSEEEKEEAAFSRKRSKKRKTDDDSSDGEEKKAKKEKKDKKSKKRKAEAEAEAEVLPKEKKSKKRKTADEIDEDASGAEQSSKETDVKESKQERKERREQEKREKKERKEKRRAEKAASKSAAESREDTSTEKKRRKEESTSAATSGTSTPIGSGTLTPTIMGSSRYLARQRFIAQKKLAFTDSTALNQVRFPFLLSPLVLCLNVS
jgi:Pin2-interacting protein X1